jgi:hypothetical protein
LHGSFDLACPSCLQVKLVPERGRGGNWLPLRLRRGAWDSGSFYTTKSHF